MIAALIGWAAPATLAQAGAARRVVVVSATAEDTRIERVHEAVAFWRETFAELGLEPPLIVSGVEVEPPGARALENFAWQISRAAGRLPDLAQGPPPPPELVALDGDVVVLLSAQPLLPFARRFAPGSARYLVAVARLRDPSLPDVVTRSVVAHELGHTLGLEHSEDPGSLMCEPCPSAADRGERAGAVPSLGPAERARLVELHGSPAARP